MTDEFDNMSPDEVVAEAVAQIDELTSLLRQMQAAEVVLLAVGAPRLSAESRQAMNRVLEGCISDRGALNS